MNATQEECFLEMMCELKETNWAGYCSMFLIVASALYRHGNHDSTSETVATIKKAFSRGDIKRGIKTMREVQSDIRRTDNDRLNLIELCDDAVTFAKSRILRRAEE